jgi:carbamoyltransferase
MRQANEVFTVLGLNFGHDASATVVEDGRILSYVARERLSRTKHVLGLDMQVIDVALRDAERGISNIDAVAVTSTQGVELISDDPSRLTVRYSSSDLFDRPFCPRFAGLDHDDIAAMGRRSLQHLGDPAHKDTPFGRYFSKVMLPKDAARLSQGYAVPWIDTFAIYPPWGKPLKLAELAEITPVASEELRYGFHVPIVATVDGREINGYAIHHHLAHAASSYYLSGFSSAAIFTHDGYDLLRSRREHGMQYDSGMFYLGSERAIYPIWPHGLAIGNLYERVGMALGLGAVGSSGKLMGLAAYGRPACIQGEFVDNAAGLTARFADPDQEWLGHCQAEARAAVDRGAANEYTAVGAHDAVIAASTQALFQEVRRKAAQSMKLMFSSKGWVTGRLCLSGGTALNCPSNSEIAASGEFDDVFIEPACDDGGIAIGAALALTHSILDRPLSPRRGANMSPYLGPKHGEEGVVRALEQYRDIVTGVRHGDTARAAAEDLAANRLVAWFEGRSEIGPRALGHRSLLADPREAENWARVNAAKGRETWRPFAPAVLEQYAGEWFADVPLPSPYMLFNAVVQSTHVPAITHVDGTARIQTVDESCGDFYRVLHGFYELTRVPLILNTSFNGPGEPLVESPIDAVNCFIACGIDVLYMEGYRVTRHTCRSSAESGHSPSVS